ncbi:hypothetical protein J6590_094431 [Homalodisca vitripennis]|nr:hypothetical protein J6590_094431 [Homalodisca vitripennis]
MADGDMWWWHTTPPTLPSLVDKERWRMVTCGGGVRRGAPYDSSHTPFPSRAMATGLHDRYPTWTGAWDCPDVKRNAPRLRYYIVRMVSPEILVVTSCTM